jgi:putative peptidoglycan lipid II flippase
MIAGTVIMGSTEIVDKSMAAVLAPGSVAALNYGNKFIVLILGLTSTAVGTAVLPYFSKLVAEKDWRNIKETLKFYLVLIFGVTIPMAAILFFLSKPLIMVVFERGLFSADDTQLVSSIQSMFAFQIPFYVGGILIVRLISSLRANHILMWGAIINLTTNILFNLLFIALFGLKGIALSTSVVYFISFFFLFYCSTKILRHETPAIKNHCYPYEKNR